jgi:shikimate dehydrogenase
MIMLPAQQRPTMYFVGVSTGHSAMQRIFPVWAETLGMPEAQLVGIDLPLRSPPATYRRIVEHIRRDPLSLGALITSHKLDMVAAAGDLIDELDHFAQLTHEATCLFMRDGMLHGQATDALTVGEALRQLCPGGYWAKSDASLLCLGAGGAALALLAHLLTDRSPDDRPRHLHFMDIDPERLAHLTSLAQRLDAPPDYISTHLHTDSAQNDVLVAGLLPGSLVINATGMGKDRPGSPLSDDACFPQSGIAWDLNYRGERPFLVQAEAQAQKRGLTVADGWDYFLLGWLIIIGEIFQVDIHSEVLVKLIEAANRLRFTA